MNYIEFCNRIFSAVKEYMGDDAEVSLDKITKNNGTVLYGLIIRTSMSKVSPTLYLEKYYELYQDSGDFGDIFTKIMSVYESNSGYSIDMDYFKDYERVRDKVILKLVNYDMNAEMLKGVPHIRWNDLAMVFCHVVDEPVLGFATILIRNDHLDFWNIDTDTIYKDACANTPKIMGDELKTMEDILMEMTSVCEDVIRKREVIDEVGIPEAGNMYVLSNKRRIFGAACILYSGYVQKVSQMYNSGVYIIPSSIHEVILIPQGKDDDESYMRQMIKDVNDNEVAIEEQLSNNLYFYDMYENEIRIQA